MTERNIFDKRKNAMEEEYFRKQEKELVEKMQRNITQESERLEIASALGTADADIVSALQELATLRQPSRYCIWFHSYRSLGQK